MSNDPYDEHTDVYIVDPDGSGLQRLTKPGSAHSLLGSGAWGPAWSPDGKKIAFVVGSFEDYSVVVMNADGGGLRRLTKKPVVGFAAAPSAPAWSPNGKEIAFDSDQSGGTIYVIRADGSGLRKLTSNAASPSWSPDGKRIAFDSGRSESSNNIYVMNADGSRLRKLTNEPRSSFGAFSPRWSPDGKKIAFWSVLTVSAEIYVMNADGSKPRRLTREPPTCPSSTCFFAARPAWSLDGRQIAFEGSWTSKKTSIGKYKRSIYVMNADGSGLHMLIRNGAHPAWQPPAGWRRRASPSKPA